jgi:glutathione S-transferase
MVLVLRGTLIRPLGINRLARHQAESHESLAAEAEQKTRACIAVVEEAVSNRGYLLGPEFCAADVMMGYSLELLAGLKVLDDQYPRAQAYLGRLRVRDAFKRAMKA